MIFMITAAPNTSELSSKFGSRMFKATPIKKMIVADFPKRLEGMTKRFFRKYI